MSNKIDIEPELLESLYWGNGYTLQQIANKFGCSYFPIRKRMVEYDISRRAGCELTDFAFTDRQKQIFEGCMLGDGNLRWSGDNCYFRYTDNQYSFLTWVIYHLGISDISTIDIGTRSYYIRTSVVPALRDEYKRWYPNALYSKYGYYNSNYKVVPRDIVLTPVGVLFWYLGDGSYGYDDVAHFKSAFYLSESNVLATQLKDVLNVSDGVSVNKHSKSINGIQCYYIRLSSFVTDKFFDIVDSLDFDIPKCYQYKFGR